MVRKYEARLKGEGIPSGGARGSWPINFLKLFKNYNSLKFQCSFGEDFINKIEMAIFSADYFLLFSLFVIF